MHIQKKITFLLLSMVFVVSTAYAGGSLFGHHKKKSNPYGVWAINTHVCKSLDCKDVDINEGKCKGRHKSWQYGVCTCDEGFVEKNGACVCDEGYTEKDGVCKQDIYISKLCQGNGDCGQCQQCIWGECRTVQNDTCQCGNDEVLVEGDGPNGENVCYPCNIDWGAIWGVSPSECLKCTNRTHDEENNVCYVTSCPKTYTLYSDGIDSMCVSCNENGPLPLTYFPDVERACSNRTTVIDGEEQVSILKECTDGYAKYINASSNIECYSCLEEWYVDDLASLCAQCPNREIMQNEWGDPTCGFKGFKWCTDRGELWDFGYAGAWIKGDDCCVGIEPTQCTTCDPDTGRVTNLDWTTLCDFEGGTKNGECHKGNCRTLSTQIFKILSDEYSWCEGQSLYTFQEAKAACENLGNGYRLAKYDDLYSEESDHLKNVVEFAYEGSCQPSYDMAGRESYMPDVWLDDCKDEECSSARNRTGGPLIGGNRFGWQNSSWKNSALCVRPR